MTPLLPQWAQPAPGPGTIAENVVAGLLADLAARALKANLAVNVKDAAYGAIGDGAADDTAAIAAAVAAAGANGRLYFPKGTYKLTSVWTISQAGIVVEGAGVGVTVITDAIPTTKSNTVAVTGSNVTLRGMTIDGSGGVAGTGVNALNIAGADFLGEELKVIGNNGARSSATRTTWRRNQSAIYLIGATDALVENNRVKHDVSGTVDTNICTAEAGSHRATIRNNRFWNSTTDDGSGTQIDGIRVTNSDECEAADNWIYRAVRYGIIVKSSNRPNVHGNRIIGPGSIRASGGSTISGIETYAGRDLVIRGNHVYQAQGFGVASHDDAGTPARDVLIEGNWAEDCGDACYSTFNSFDARIVNNDSRNCSDGIRVGEGTPFGPSPPNTSWRATIENNRIFDTAAHGVYIAGSLSCSVKYNHFHNCAWYTGQLDWPSSIIVLTDGATVGATGVRIAHNRVTRDGTQIATLLGVGGPDFPSAANLPTSIPRYFVRSTASGATYPSALTGWSEIHDNELSGIARGALGGQFMQLQPTDSAWSNLFPTTEQILSLDAGGSAGAADAVDRVEGTGSWAVTAGASGNTTADFALGGYDCSLLPDDAFFEIAVRLMDANFSALEIRLAQGASDANAFLVGTFTLAMLEPPAAGWFRLRFRKGDLTASGTATWANVTDLRLKVSANAGGSAIAKFDDFRVSRVG